MSRITLDGNTACARVAYALSEIASIYPITPSSNMGELVDKWSHEQQNNLFGSPVVVKEMQSEAGAAGAMHGALSAGALATTFTSSQGLLLMIPNMYKIAGELLPNVIHVSSRAIATHALSIFGDHSDVMATRQTGYAQLCSSSVQEVQDFALASHIATLKTRVPFVHFFDGFRTSHEINTINSLDWEKVKTIYPYHEANSFKARSLNSSHPTQKGTSQNPDIFFQNREAANIYYNNAPAVVQEVFAQIESITGRKYNLFDYYGSKIAKHVLVLMGSGATTARSTVEFLNQKSGNEYGVLVVRLFRPFNVQAFVNKLPASTQTITVLDRTKEPGSIGEPLYQDVVSAVFESGKKDITVLGGRYGLGNKEFTPTMVEAVFQNAKHKTPKNHFTVGITDDLTHTSLTLGKPLITCENRMVSCKFYGYGGDGTVSANKSSIKIIAEHAKLYGQAYFEYDSKKNGNSTIVHMRYGIDPINECYLLNNISFVGCHNQTYLTKFNLLKDIKTGGTFLLNTNYSFEKLQQIMPNALKREIATKKLNFYTIDAYSLSLKHNLRGKINLIMQTAFFKLNDIIDFDTAKNAIKNYAAATYEKVGEKFLQQNYNAINETEENLVRVNYPESWATLNTQNGAVEENLHQTSDYFKNFINPIQRLEGDNLPVSAFSPDGVVPTGTSKMEKRGTATQLPCWLSQNCVQCNLCSFVCPHAAIRTHLVSEENLHSAPDGFVTIAAFGEGDKRFVVQLNPLDCTGCGVCANVCPAKNKALVMVPTTQINEKEQQNYNFLQTVKKETSILPKNTVKGIGFHEPYFEFSGACAGCGQTPYIKVLTQLFGDKMIIANATGCTSIYGGTAPACPYTTDSNGNGVAWANSLFEDNAEFGLGIKLGEKQKRGQLTALLKQLLTTKISNKLQTLLNNYLTATSSDAQREISTEIIAQLELAKQNVENSQQNDLISSILQLRDSFVTQSVWIMGGDGWAYDIGYGGLDHVLNSKENINILVLDTEVYSNTGGQASKATPIGAVAKFEVGGKRTHKKDLALISSLYKDVYVAKVSMGANRAQLMKAFTEAESYNGVSIIIAYAPCIEHGIDMRESQNAMKLAIDTGYWHLWRYDPRRRQNGENPFVLDSPAPSKPLIDFLQSEGRFKILQKNSPDTAKELFSEAQTHATQLYDFYKFCSENNIL